MRDEICDVCELFAVLFDDGAGDDADVKFFGQCAVGVEVFLVLGRERDEVRVIWQPICQVVFWEYG